MDKILIVDDDTTFCIMLKNWLEKRGFKVEPAFSYKSAVELLQKNGFDAILTDLRLPDEDGIALLQKSKEIDPKVPVILMTGYADIQTAVKAIKLGAYDYVSKPVIPDEILKKLQEALEKKGAAEGLRDQAEPVAASGKTPSQFHYIHGVSDRADKLQEYISLVGPTMMTVLIHGESGTGKEYVARLIHASSKRNDGPFVAVDCGAVPKDLAGSEFFGHVKGSFTSAISDKEGYFSLASGGTLFLDEIGNLPYDVQVQLLRVLEERKVRPIGAVKDLAVDVRIISATNENLKEAVIKGHFREDLYHRINEFSLEALPLRERKEDIELFANHFLDRSNQELDKHVIGFDPGVMDIFKNYSWPGNLREMRNIVKRATLLCTGKFISKDQLPPELWQHEQSGSDQSFGSRRKEIERELIRDVMRQCRGNKSEAARILQIDRKTLYSKLKQYDLEDL